MTNAQLLILIGGIWFGNAVCAPHVKDLWQIGWCSVAAMAAGGIGLLLGW